VELAADGDSPVCGKAPSGETGPTGAEGGAASVGELPVGASRGRDVPRAAPSGRPPPVVQLLTSPVPSSSTATARATPRRPRPGPCPCPCPCPCPTHLPAATAAPAEPTEVVQLAEVLPAVPAFPSPLARPRRYAAAGRRVRAAQGDRASTRARRGGEVQGGQASTRTRLGVPTDGRLSERLAYRSVCPAAQSRTAKALHEPTPQFSISASGMDAVRG
jgi:hypothetical protein